MMKEKYLLDADSFIAPYNNYYSFDIAPAFWRQLEPLLKREDISVLDVVLSEVKKGDDELTEWIDAIEDINIIKRQDPKIVEGYGKVINYILESPLYNNQALHAWSENNVADPWLISAASAYDYIIVTFEQSSGPISSESKRPKIPDVAKEMGVRCENLYYFMRKTGIKFV